MVNNQRHFPRGPRKTPWRPPLPRPIGYGPPAPGRSMPPPHADRAPPPSPAKGHNRDQPVKRTAANGGPGPSQETKKAKADTQPGEKGTKAAEAKAPGAQADRPGDATEPDPVLSNHMQQNLRLKQGRKLVRLVICVIFSYIALTPTTVTALGQVENPHLDTNLDSHVPLGLSPGGTDWPLISLRKDGDNTVIVTHTTSREAIFEQQQLVFDLSPYILLEHEILNGTQKLLDFYNGQTRLHYVGPTTGNGCHSACADLSMSIAEDARLIPDLIGPDQEYWIKPTRLRDAQTQYCPANPEALDGPALIEYLAILNTSKPSTECQVKYEFEPNDSIYFPSCEEKSYGLTSGYIKYFEIDDHKECQLYCLSDAKCGGFTFIQRGSHNNTCELATHFAGMEPISKINGEQQFIYTDFCDSCRAMGTPHLRDGNHRFPIKGNCLPRRQKRSKAHCVCQTENLDSESTLGIGMVNTV